MMSRHFGLSSELSVAIAKRLPHAKNQLSTPGNFFNQFVTDIVYRQPSPFASLPFAENVLSLVLLFETHSLE